MMPTTTVTNVEITVPDVGAGELQQLVRDTRELGEAMPAAPARGVEFADAGPHADGERPTLGWIKLDSLRVLSGRLLADVEAVPATLARTLGRRGVAELKQSRKIGGRVLAAVA